LRQCPKLPDSCAVMAPRPAPVCVVGKYEVYPLSVCSEDAIAALFAKICNRGNPLLQGKPDEDLLRLGVAFYRKSSPYVGSVVCLLGDEPVALSFGWDCADGGVWKGTAGPPASLLAHAAVGGAVWGTWPDPFTLPERRGEFWFGAFGGVTLPHPGSLMGVMAMIAFPWMLAVGYRYNFGYVVHPTLLEQQKRMEANTGERNIGHSDFTRWVTKYNEIEATDPTVRDELASYKPGYTNCTIMEMNMVMESFDTRRPFVKAAQACAGRLGKWGTEAYGAETAPVLALPAKADLEYQVKAKL